MVKYLTIGILTMLLFALSSCTLKSKKMTNLEIIRSTYEGKTSEENGANLEKFVASDIRWTEAKGFPYAGIYVGIKDITKNVFSRLGSEWDAYKFTPEEYVATDNTVVAIGTYSGVYKQTNKAFSARVTHIWKLKNSKIVSFEQIVDSKTVVDAMI